MSAHNYLLFSKKVFRRVVGIKNVWEIWPCIRITPLDAFRESGYDWPDVAKKGDTLDPVTGEVLVEGKLIELRTLLDKLDDGVSDKYGIWSFEDRPSFRDGQEVINKAMSGEFRGFANNTNAMIWPRNLVIGGFSFDPNNNTQITHAKALESLILTAPSTELYYRHHQRVLSEYAVDMTVKDFTTILEQWDDLWLDAIHKVWTPSIFSLLFLPFIACNYCRLTKVRMSR